LGMALDEPNENDKVLTINEIQVAIDAQIIAETDDLVVEYDEGRNAIVLSGNESECH
jgi:Fe-S cluster assembly iron-binding protein IscA